jgi:hypothetical protein
VAEEEAKISGSQGAQVLFPHCPNLGAVSCSEFLLHKVSSDGYDDRLASEDMAKNVWRSQRQQLSMLRWQQCGELKCYTPYHRREVVGKTQAEVANLNFFPASLHRVSLFALAVFIPYQPGYSEAAYAQPIVRPTSDNSEGGVGASAHAGSSIRVAVLDELQRFWLEVG